MPMPGSLGNHIWGWADITFLTLPNIALRSEGDTYTGVVDLVLRASI